MPQVAHLVAEEFFQQGDLEQKELGMTPEVIELSLRT